METALAKYKTTGDAKMACKYLRKYSISTTVEGRLLWALSTASNDLIGALNKVFISYSS